MKILLTSVWVAVWFGVSALAQPTAQPPQNDVAPPADRLTTLQIGELGDHYRVWQQVTVETDRYDNKIYHTNAAYTELETGMNVRQPDGSSMNETNADGITKIVAARKAATNFVGHLLLPDEGGIKSFWSGTTNNQRLTSNYVGVINVISNLATASGTCIDYGITNAQAKLQSTNHNKAALSLMVVLTDGRNEGGTSSNVVIAAAAVKAADIRIIAVAFGTNADTTLLKYSVASSTNDYYYATNSSQLDGVYDLIANSICRGASNQPPVIQFVTTNLNYTENAAATVLSTNATVTDLDSMDFNTGMLTIDYSANGQAEDWLAIRNQATGAGQIGISGTNVTYAGTNTAAVLLGLFWNFCDINGSYTRDDVAHYYIIW